MARSVSIPSGAVKVAYADSTELDQDDWHDAVSNLRWNLRNRYPSLRHCNEWIGREDRAILANDHAFITVSEYCGISVLCVVPRNDSKKAADWCDKVKLDQAVEYLGAPLLSKGRFSNGEQVFVRRDTRENISSNGSRW